MPISGPICQCQHTHVYGGVAYIDCPYCDCHEHTHNGAVGETIYNIKRWKRWERNHKQLKTTKAAMFDYEINQMIASIKLVA